MLKKQINLFKYSRCVRAALLEQQLPVTRRFQGKKQLINGTLVTRKVKKTTSVSYRGFVYLMVTDLSKPIVYGINPSYYRIDCTELV